VTASKPFSHQLILEVLVASLLDTRRTRWTDASGRLKEEFKGAWDQQYVAKALDAGVSEHWLLPNGSILPVGSGRWNAEGSLDGVWTDLVYTLGCCLRGTDWADHRTLGLRQNIRHVVHCYEWMAKLLNYLGIPEDLPGLIPLEVLEWRVRHYQIMGWELPRGVVPEEAEEPELVKAW
jgi:hypothetical protein